MGTATGMHIAAGLQGLQTTKPLLSRYLDRQQDLCCHDIWDFYIAVVRLSWYGIAWTQFWVGSELLLLPSALMRSAGSACQRLSIIWPISSYSPSSIDRSGRWLSTLAAWATVFCGRCPNGFSPAQRRHGGNGGNNVRRMAHSVYTRSISRL